MLILITSRNIIFLHGVWFSFQQFYRTSCLGKINSMRLSATCSQLTNIILMLLSEGNSKSRVIQSLQIPQKKWFGLRYMKQSILSRHMPLLVLPVYRHRPILAIVPYIRIRNTQLYTNDNGTNTSYQLITINKRIFLYMSHINLGDIFISDYILSNSFFSKW